MENKLSVHEQVVQHDGSFTEKMCSFTRNTRFYKFLFYRPSLVKTSYNNQGPNIKLKVYIILLMWKTLKCSFFYWCYILCCQNLNKKNKVTEFLLNSN